VPYKKEQREDVVLFFDERLKIVFHLMVKKD